MNNKQNGTEGFSAIIFIHLKSDSKSAVFISGAAF